jgi:hypothetical protein
MRQHCDFGDRHSSQFDGWDTDVHHGVEDLQTFPFEVPPVWMHRPKASPANARVHTVSGEGEPQQSALEVQSSPSTAHPLAWRHTLPPVAVGTQVALQQSLQTPHGSPAMRQLPVPGTPRLLQMPPTPVLFSVQLALQQSSSL